MSGKDGKDVEDIKMVPALDGSDEIHRKETLEKPYTLYKWTLLLQRIQES